ncbi:2-hydroxyacid dehydrogenase [Granulosicoccus antarcticus]|uniref:Glyoxylate/hydroxypyruvate reductase A n=1 Tax=Granulosicoccus antarcticus IMCC3135 TaxID=1192854 RepID=A0A2Z2NL61_9GAMM|nr:glyoxylate/hydroxypyruvate reductase A [Granulosicoccus antarcticus]ASJ72066.1 Glyoxylate/hydroxypyruvate reductase A [Granulosicoccus antarcticus IMCC3135]
MTTLIPLVHQMHAEEASEWLATLQRLLPRYDIRLFDELGEQERSQCRIAIVANPDPHQLVQMPALIWVHSLWAGVERMVAELADVPVDIVRLVDPCLTQTMSEAVLAWVLYLHRDMPLYRRQQAASLWQQKPYVAAGERHVTVLGLGELGGASAQRLQQNSFMTSGWSRSLKSLDGVQCHTGRQGLEELFEQSDIIVNLLPLTPDTQALLDRKLFKKMKASACLINFGRGATIVEEDLVAALNDKQFAHAVLDVFEQEPVSASSALWSHPRITLLPHISAQTTIESASRIIADNIVNYLDHAVMPEVVDKSRRY